MGSEDEAIKVLIFSSVKLSKYPFGDSLLSNKFNLKVECDIDSFFKKNHNFCPDIILIIKDTLSNLIENFGKIRDAFSVPVLVIGNHFEEIYQIVAYELGIVDCIDEKIDPRIFILKIFAHLKQVDESARKIKNDKVSVKLDIGRLEVYQSSRKILINKNEIQLSSFEYDVFLVLAKHPGQIVSREKIYKIIKGTDYTGVSRSVDISISRIRSRIGDNPINSTCVKTIRNKGYMLMVSDSV
ncbi:winged helix-turn-helix domain-containing protein [Microbulbifer sp. GL-2]|uniref:winged helix-turn-helix domain-containing protein n=1 Tax=Microbulbifer sp. GL-2 TaxID=2591606 RepID=UPI001164D362|nr:winged helix-turn-helix domain-containing protein [Microbulbifer sp. GL-2]BBM02892.1 hypothetical protein GL2_29660 [Microbulbifer sp. GL-2]